MLLESRSKNNTLCKIKKPSRRGRTFTQKQTDHTSYEEKAKLRAPEKNSIEKASMLRKSDDKAGATSLCFSLNQIHLQLNKITLHFLSYSLKNYGRQWTAPLIMHLISKCDRSKVLPRRCTAWKCSWHIGSHVYPRHIGSRVYLSR